MTWIFTFLLTRLCMNKCLVSQPLAGRLMGLLFLLITAMISGGARPNLSWPGTHPVSYQPDLLKKAFFKNTNWTRDADRCAVTSNHAQSCDSYNADLRFCVRASSLEAVCQISCSFLCNLKRLYTTFFHTCSQSVTCLHTLMRKIGGITLQIMLHFNTEQNSKF